MAGYDRTDGTYIYSPSSDSPLKNLEIKYL